MDHIDVTPDSSLPAYLSIPTDAKSALPARSLSVNELLQYEFPNPFWTPYAGGHVPTWSSSPPHHVHTTVLLSYGIPQRKVTQELLLDLQQLPSAPQSINRAALSSCFPAFCPSGCYLSGIAYPRHTSPRCHGGEASIQASPFTRTRWVVS